MSNSGVRLDQSLVQAALEEAAPSIVEAHLDETVIVRDGDTGKLQEDDVPDRLTEAELRAAFARKDAVDVKGDHGATGDGVTDDSAAFAAAIATGAKYVTVPRGSYLLTGQTLNQAGQTLLPAPGATFKAKAGSQTLFTITAAGAGIVAVGPGVVVDGNGVGTTVGSTVYVNGAADARVEGMFFQNCAGFGINAQGTRITVKGNTFVNCGSTSIYVKPPTTGADLDSPRITDNTVRNTNDVNGIQLHGNSPATVQRPKVSGNDVTLPATGTAGIAIELYGGCHHAIVAANATTGGFMGISLDTCTYSTVDGNAAGGAYSVAIELAACTTCTVADNVVDGNSVTVVGVQGSQATNGGHTITGNAISNLKAVTGVAIHLTGTASGNGSARLTVVSGNRLTGVRGLLLEFAYGTTVTGNVFVGAAGATSAIEASNCTNLTILGNTAEAFALALLNIYTGAMSNVLLGPNNLTGGTPAHYINGPLGAGSREFTTP